MTLGMRVSRFGGDDKNVMRACEDGGSTDAQLSFSRKYNLERRVV